MEEYTKILKAFEEEYLIFNSFKWFKPDTCESRQIDDIKKDITAIIMGLKNKEIPYEYPSDILSSFSLREYIVSIQGFTLLTVKWLKEFSAWIGDRKCLEIMGGLGSLSAVLKSYGVDVICTDNFSWDKFNFTETWCDVENIDCVDAIVKYGKSIDIVIMSWSYMDDTAYRALNILRQVNPKAVLVHIGEDAGGCTADDSFFNTIRIIDDMMFEKMSQYYQSWDRIYDKPLLVN